MSERVYRVSDTVVSVGVGFVRAKSKAEAIQKANDGLVEFVYEPQGARLSARWLRDPDEARRCDPEASR